MMIPLSITVFWAQDQSILWQKTIGGNASDVVTSLKKSSDGGYVLAGYSASNVSGEKSENSRGKLDGWIVKTNSSGSILWDKTYGGSGDDFLISIDQTTDGGFIVGLGSDSNISGDKTENSRGGLDFWILKINASGNIEWQKTYGGAQPEFDTHVFQTADGGYFVSGYSDSGISGDKTEASNGQRDYWALRLNSSGDILWQNSIGGSLIDRATISTTSQDGGYVIGGFSTSSSTGDKTENSRGASDNWIVKLDANGNVVWDKTFGGSSVDLVRDVLRVSDGYVVGGYSDSGISGDKTGALRGEVDYWIYKLDFTGNMLWQKTLGGSMTDYLRTIRQKPDANLLVTGYSNSNISGDKTENSNGGYDMWFLLLDANGEILGQNTIGGAGDESSGYSIILNDGYIFSVASASNSSGDKTDDSRGLEDYWIFETNNNLLGLASLEDQAKFAIYPNPSKDFFYIDFGALQSSAIISIFDLSGKKVYQKNFNNVRKDRIHLDAANGAYIMKVQLEDGNTFNKKLIKQN